MQRVEQTASDDARPRVVLLGASNLTLGISTITQMARAQVGRPCDMLIALGHGRSFGQWSSVLGRRLPGILECELWRALEAGKPAPTWALITDVGNDIAYGVDPETLARWLAEAVSRLRAADSRIVMTALPVESLRRLGRRRFELFRRLYFPLRPFRLEQLHEHVESLDGMMRRMTHGGCVALAEQRGAWYGFDPIHLRARHWNEAWSHVLSHWEPGKAKVRLRAGTRPWRWLSLLTATPAERFLWGLSQGAVQPARTWRDGTTLSFY